MLNLSDLLFVGLVLSIVALSPFVEKAKLPTSALVIIVGVLIGPAGFSLLAFTEGIRLFSELAIVLILFYAGLEVQWHRFVIALRPGFYVALAGIVLSALLGMAVSLSFDSNMEQALYIGAALAATSIGLSVPLLKQANLLQTRMGQILLAAAIIDDVLAMYFLSALHTSLSAQGDLGRLVVGLIIGALVLILVALLNAALASLLKKTLFDGRVVLVTGLLFIGALVSGAVTWAVDMSLAVGAFLSGAVMAWSGIGQKYRVPLIFLSGFLVWPHRLSFSLSVFKLPLFHLHQTPCGSLRLPSLWPPLPESCFPHGWFLSRCRRVIVGYWVPH